jgi:hypothetical protein
MCSNGGLVEALKVRGLKTQRIKFKPSSLNLKLTSSQNREEELVVIRGTHNLVTDRKDFVSEDLEKVLNS